MEGVPRLPMLRTTLKTSPEKTDFSRKIKWQIRELFNENPNSYSNEIREIESLRASACHPPQDITGCGILKKYYCQLHFLQNRFSFDESTQDDCFFTWTDMYTGIAYSTTDMKHEMACVLYNIGALHMNLGAMDNRQTPEGMKMSCSHFQCAAWAFQQLNEKYPQPRETDLCHEIIRFLGTVSLAQAQECILEKSMVDGRKPGIVAKVAAQIVDYYKTALKVLEQGNAHPDGNAVREVAGDKAYKSWKKYAEFKMSFYQCVVLLYMGMHSEESQKMGERVAYYQAASDKLNEAAKLAKKLDGYAESVNDAVSFSHDVVGGKLKASEKENEFVYHEKVPERSSLSEIKGASLVKGTAFDLQDPEVAGQDIFHRLVPMEAHEASSFYSEEKAKLLRRIGGLVENKDQELALFLTSLQVDQLRLHHESAGLPQELIDRCAAFSVETNVAPKLIEAMSELSSVYTDVESCLAEVKEILNEEHERERQHHGPAKRPPSMILNELSLEANRYSEAHAKGADSNTLLHKAINAHLPNLRTLSLPLAEIKSQLPSFQMLDSSKDQASIKELQRLLDKVEEMRKQRRMLYTQFREGIQADDITKLATHQTDLEALFAQELSKHQRVTSLIEQNLSAQEKILIALTEANARYADTRRATSEIQQRRDAAVAALIASADAYPDLLAKCSKGLEFYRKMESNATKLLTRLRSVCRVQQEEREQQEAARSRPPVIEKNESQEGPKLKDFLHLMKKDRAPGEPIVAPVAATAPPAPGGAETPAQFTYPYHRPAPLGAEQADINAPQRMPYAMDGPSFYYQNQPSAYSQGAAGTSYPASTLSAPVASTTSAPTYAYPSYYQSAGYPSTYHVAASVSHQPANMTYMNQQASTAPTPMSTSVAATPVSSSPQPLPAGYSASLASATPYATQTGYPYYNQASAAATPSTYASAANSYPPTMSVPMAYGAVPPSSYYGATSASSYAPNNTSTTVANGSMATYGSNAVANPPASTAQPAYPAFQDVQAPVSYPSSVPSSYGQYQYHPYYAPSAYSYATTAASSTTTTTSTSTTPSAYHYAYNYLTNHTNPIDAYGGYNHGMTGSTITGPSTGHASSGTSLCAAPSGSGTNQYQQYPYHPTPADPASAYYQAGTYNQQQYPSQQVLQPTPVAPAVATPAPSAIVSSESGAVEKATSNLELLSLLDLSVPANPNGAVLPAALEPQSGTSPFGGNIEHQGTTTLSGSLRNAMIGPVATATNSGKSISSSVESPINSSNVTLPAEVKPVASQPAVHKDLLADPEAAAKLASEVEKLDKLVDGLTRKSLNGPTSLDTRWKEVQDLQEKESVRRSISVARCYPMKNRLPDVLPYDHNRVELPTTKDDYINASKIPSLSSGAPSFVATQAPLPCSQQDFWTMIWQECVEIIACLLSDAEMTKPGSSASGVYWPMEKGRDVVCGPWTVSLHSSNVRAYCHERILALSKQGESKQRILVHLQFTSWPGSSFPASPAQFLQLVSQTLHFWEQQRSRSHPIVVHCLAGAGRTGLFCLLCTALSDLSAGNGLLDVVRVSGALCQHRRNMFRDREHLLFAYQALLYHAQDLLLKRGILSGTASLQGSPVKKSHPSQDFTCSTPMQTPLDSTPGTAAKAEVVNEQKEETVDTAEEEAILEAAASEQKTTNNELHEQVKKCPSPVVVPALAILDPANFTLDGGQPSRQRVTKDSFLNKTSSQLGAAKDPADPLSQLDPLWSLAKP